MAHARMADATGDGPPQVRYEVAVRALCEFTAKQGDLDVRFTPSPSAEEGVAGHRVIAARRGPHYESELTLAADHGMLHVRGRADGYDSHTHQLEEFKTYRGDSNRIPLNYRALHWAQLRIYGWLLCNARGCDEVPLALVYFNIATEEETVFIEAQSAHALREHFAQHCERFLGWAAAETAHRLARDQALQELRFPYAATHTGQRQLAEAVYSAARAGRSLLAQAPTGSGKTIGTLFPALKALPPARLDKLFYLDSHIPVGLCLLRQASMAAARRQSAIARSGSNCRLPGALLSC